MRDDGSWHDHELRMLEQDEDLRARIVFEIAHVSELIAAHTGESRSDVEARLIEAADCRKENEMPLNASDKGGGDFKKVSPGSHFAVCTMVVDLGLQASGYGPKHRCYLRFEVPGERTEWEKDGKKMTGPMTIGMTLTVSLSRKSTMRGLLETWRGRPFSADELKGFDLFKLAGAPAMLTVIHEPDERDPGKIYANIAGIAKLPNGSTAPKPEGEVLTYGADNTASYDKLPDWLKERIAKQLSPTPEDAPAPSPAAGGASIDDDDIPF